MGLIIKFLLLFAVLKVRAENLKKEKDILKMSDVRLTQQRESLLVEQRGQNLLLTNLRTIQVCGVILTSKFDVSFRVFNKYPLKWNKTVMGLGHRVDYVFCYKLTLIIKYSSNLFKQVCCSCRKLQYSVIYLGES